MFDFARWLQLTPLSVALQSRAWVIPALQVVHILMMAVVLGSILMVALRLLGRAWAEQPPHRVARRFMPWLWVALAVNLATGAVLTLAEPLREFSATSYWLKLALILIGAAGALALQRRLRSAADGAGPAEPTPGLRAAAVATLVLWLAVIFLGRAIAYDVEVWGRLSLTTLS